MSKPNQPRLVEFPPSPFGGYLEHMNNSGCPEWVWSFIEMCGTFGVLHSTPTDILLARPVSSAIPEDDLLAFNDLDPNHPLASSFLTKPHDTWHILYASGDTSLFFDLCPYELPFVSWHRNKGDGSLRVRDFQRLKKRFHGK